MDTETVGKVIQIVTAMTGGSLGFSYLAELVPQWHRLKPAYKKAINKLVILVVAILAIALVQYAPDTGAALVAGAQAFIAVTGSHGVQQAYHKLSKGKAGPE